MLRRSRAEIDTPPVRLVAPIARGHVRDWLSKGRHPRFSQRGFA